MRKAMEVLLISSVFMIFIIFFSVPSHALNIGLKTTASRSSVSKECSKKCESAFCSVPPFLRYGKYCGLLYSGCPGERPCDELDVCCMQHDACIGPNNDYLSQKCSKKFMNCMESFKKRGGHTFKGNKCHTDDVIEAISVFMEAALLAGRYLQKP